MRSVAYFFSTILIFGACALADGVPGPALKAGAAKVDVTPAESELPKNYEGILDHIYARAVVIDNGATSAALVTLDAGGMPEQLWQNVTKRAESELGIPAKNILMTATHTHAVPRIAGNALEGKVFQAVKEAKTKLQPARVGFGTSPTST